MFRKPEVANKVLSLLGHAAGLIWLARSARRGDRRAQLGTQFHRAALLPEYGVRKWSNQLAHDVSHVDVSVLVTCFNYEQYVEIAVRSVFPSAADPVRVEIVVVDDASSDGSLALLLRLLAESPLPFRIVRPWWNVGLSRARNLALRNARGTFVFILDADNAVAPSALARLHALAQTEDAAAAYGPIRCVTTDGENAGWLSDRPFDPAFLRNQGNYIDAMAMFRRDLLEEIGGYDVDLLRTIGGWEDYVLWLELAVRGCKVVFDGEVMGTYLTKPDSMVSRITTSELESAERLLRSRYAS